MIKPTRHSLNKTQQSLSLSNLCNLNSYLYFNHNQYLNLNPYQYQLRHELKRRWKRKGAVQSVRKIAKHSLGVALTLNTPMSFSLAFQLQRPRLTVRILRMVAGERHTFGCHWRGPWRVGSGFSPISAKIRQKWRIERVSI